MDRFFICGRSGTVVVVVVVVVSHDRKYDAAFPVPAVEFRRSWDGRVRGEFPPRALGAVGGADVGPGFGGHGGGVDEEDLEKCLIWF